MRAAGVAVATAVLALALPGVATAGLPPASSATLKFTITNYTGATLTLDTTKTTVTNGKFSDSSGEHSETPPASIASGSNATTYSVISKSSDPYSGTLAYVDTATSSGLAISWQISDGGDTHNITCNGYGPEGGAYDCTGFTESFPSQETWPVTATAGCPGSPGNCPWTWAGGFGTEGSGPGQFDNPLAMDQNGCNGNLYVADTGNGRWQLFSSQGAFVNQFTLPSGIDPVGITSVNPCAEPPDTPLIGIVDDTTDSVFLVQESSGQVVANFGAGVLSNPQGIGSGLDDETVYVADTGNNRIVAFSLTGTVIATIGSGNGPLAAPRAVNARDLGSLNSLLVADSGNDRTVLFGQDPPEYNDLTGFPATAVGDTDAYFVAAAGPNVVLYNVLGAELLSAGEFGGTGTAPGQFGAAGAGDGGGGYAPGVFFLTDPSNDRFQMFYLPESQARLASSTAPAARGQARVSIRCLGPRRCRGDATLYRKAKRVGRRTFRIAARKRRSVRVSLNAATRRALSTNRRVRVRAVVHVPGRAHTRRASRRGARFLRREPVQLGRVTIVRRR
jgi:hypothetical protein